MKATHVFSRKRLLNGDRLSKRRSSSHKLMFTIGGSGRSFNFNLVRFDNITFAKQIKRCFKFKCNTHLRKLGFMVPESEIIQDKKSKNIQFPCIIKPACSGSSFGIAKVHNHDELEKAIYEAKKYDRYIIQEQFIKGREVTCAVFNDKQTIKTLPITEIIFSELFL